METRANYIAIGIFVLIVLAGAFGSLWWLYRASGTGATAALRIIFPEAVTGLSTGAGVYFNGIRVGEVTSLEFPPEGGDTVIAITRVNPNAPIKVNTQAQLASQGLTGVAYVSLVGGSGESIFEAAEKDDTTPTLEAATSAFTNVLDTLQSVLGRLDSTLGSVRELIDDNQGNLSGVVQNVRTFTDELAKASPQIPGMIDDVSTAASAISSATPEVTKMIETANDLIAAIDPSRISGIVTNVENFTAELPKVGTQATTVVNNVNGLVTRLDDTAATLGDAIRSIDDVVKSIDANAVNDIMANVQTASKTIADHSADIGTLLGNASTISADLSQITDTVAQKREALGQAITDAGALIADARSAVDAATPAIQSLSKAAGAITPERVTTIVDNVEAVTTTFARQSENIGSLISAATDAATGIDSVTKVLSERSEAIGSTIDDASRIASSLREASAGVPQLVTSAEGLLNDAAATVRAVDAERINKVVSNVENFTTALADQGPAVAELIQAANGTAQRAEAIASSIAQRMPQIGTAIDDATATVESVRIAAARLPQLVASLEPGITNVADALGAIDPAAIDGIVTNVRTVSDAIAAQAPAIERIVTGVDTVVDQAGSIASDVKAVTGQLAGRSEAIGATIDNASSAVESVRTAAADLPKLVNSLEPGITNVADALSAIDPQSIETIVNNITDLSNMLAAQGPTIGRVIDRAESVLTDAGSIAADARVVVQEVASRRAEIGTAIDDATAAVANVRQAAEKAPELMATLQPGIANIADVLGAIDPTAIEGIVGGVKTLTDTLSAKAPAIDSIIASVDTASGNVATVTTTLTERMPQIEAAMDNVSASLADVRVFTQSLPEMATSLQPGIENISAVLSAIDPAAVSQIVDNVGALSTTLSDSRENVTQIISTVGEATRRIDEVVAAVSARSQEIGGAIDSVAAFAGKLGDAAPSIDGIVANVSRAANTVADTVSAIDTSAINQILANARTFANTIGSRSSEIGTTIDEAVAAVKNVVSGLQGAGGDDGLVKEVLDKVRRIADNVETASQKLDGVMSRANNVLGNEVSRLFDGVNGATARIEEVAAAFAPRAGQIANGLSRFSQGGLDDLRALINQGRSTLQAIESAVSSFDRDPSRVIFGGDNAPRYSPQRR